MSRERQLFMGDFGTGKTRALFDVMVFALNAGHKAFFFSMDDGHERFLPRVEGWEEKGMLFINTPTRWTEMREMYRATKALWEKGDYVLMDRLDLIWEWIQQHYKAEKYGVDQEDLANFSLDRRFELLAQADKLDKAGDIRRASAIRNAVNMDGPAELDWDLLKSSLASVTYEVAAGRDAIQYQINYFATTWAVPGIQARTSAGEQKVETDASKTDPRKLRSFNMTIQGEKHVPGYFDTRLVFRKLPQGYTMSTVEDRERDKFDDEIIGKDGFVETYQALVNVRFG